MKSTGDCFAPSYAQARAKFLAATEAAGLDAFSHPHPILGRDGEALAMDVVREGPADAKSLLLISSACHGAEGFCGSGVQVALLRDAGWHARVRERGAAVLYVHALNPYGFSWLRRVTHEGVETGSLRRREKLGARLRIAGRKAVADARHRQLCGCANQASARRTHIVAPSGIRSSLKS